MTTQFGDDDFYCDCYDCRSCRGANGEDLDDYDDSEDEDEDCVCYPPLTWRAIADTIANDRHREYDSEEAAELDYVHATQAERDLMRKRQWGIRNIDVEGSSLDRAFTVLHKLAPSVFPRGVINDTEGRLKARVIVMLLRILYHDADLGIYHSEKEERLDVEAPTPAQLRGALTEMIREAW